jgi:hypothetical protein
MSTGYGRDTWCLDSLQPGRIVSGRTLVAQALYRRWTTPRGTLRGKGEESVYGIDVVGIFGSMALPAVLAALPGRMRAEALKDDRVLDVRVTLSSTTDSAGLTTVVASAQVTLADDAESFTLTLSITDTTVELIGGLPQ